MTWTWTPFISCPTRALTFLQPWTILGHHFPLNFKKGGGRGQKDHLLRLLSINYRQEGKKWGEKFGQVIERAAAAWRGVAHLTMHEKTAASVGVVAGRGRGRVSW